MSGNLQTAEDSASGPRLHETNWAWLAEQTEGVACELCADGEPGDPRLHVLFSTVVSRPANAGFSRGLDEGSVDAVVIQGWPTGKTTPTEDFLVECRRVLRPGGYIVFSTDHARWYHRLIQQIVSRRRREQEAHPSQLPRDIRSAERQLKRVGFDNVRCYLGDGSATRLKTLVPVSSAALCEMGRTRGRWTARRVLRSILTRLGLGSLFYRTLLVFGYR